AIGGDGDTGVGLVEVGGVVEAHGWRREGAVAVDALHPAIEAAAGVGLVERDPGGLAVEGDGGVDLHAVDPTLHCERRAVDRDARLHLVARGVGRRVSGVGGVGDIGDVRRIGAV